MPFKIKNNERLRKEQDLLQGVDVFHGVDTSNAEFCNHQLNS